MIFGMPSILISVVTVILYSMYVEKLITQWKSLL